VLFPLALPSLPVLVSGCDQAAQISSLNQGNSVLGFDHPQMLLLIGALEAAQLDRNQMTSVRNALELQLGAKNGESLSFAALIEVLSLVLIENSLPQDSISRIIMAARGLALANAKLVASTGGEMESAKKRFLEAAISELVKRKIRAEVILYGYLSTIKPGETVDREALLRDIASIAEGVAPEKTQKAESDPDGTEGVGQDNG
jgi:hypothetical protein